MISCHFNLKIPGLNRWSIVKVWHGSIRNHKHWEIQINRVSSLIGADFGWTLSGNHPGVRLGVCLFGFEFAAEIYDERHDVGVFQ